MLPGIFSALWDFSVSKHSSALEGRFSNSRPHPPEVAFAGCTVKNKCHLNSKILSKHY